MIKITVTQDSKKYNFDVKLPDEAFQELNISIDIAKETPNETKSITLVDEDKVPTVPTVINTTDPVINGSVNEIINTTDPILNRVNSEFNALLNNQIVQYLTENKTRTNPVINLSRQIQQTSAQINNLHITEMYNSSKEIGIVHIPAADYIHFLPNYVTIKSTQYNQLELFAELCDIIDEWFIEYNSKQREDSDFVSIVENYFRNYLIKFVWKLTKEELDEFMVIMATNGVDDKAILLLKDIYNGNLKSITNLMDYTDCNCSVCKLQQHI